MLTETQRNSVNAILDKYEAKKIIDNLDDPDSITAHSWEAYKHLLGMSDDDIKEIEKVACVELKHNYAFAEGLKEKYLKSGQIRRGLFYLNLETKYELLREISETHGHYKLWGTWLSTLWDEYEEVFSLICFPNEFEEALAKFEKEPGRVKYDKWELRSKVLTGIRPTTTNGQHAHVLTGNDKPAKPARQRLFA